MWENIDAHEGYIQQQRIPRGSLLSISKSPWHCAYQYADGQALITLTGFDLNSFNFLLTQFAPVYEQYKPFALQSSFPRLKDTLAYEERGKR